MWIGRGTGMEWKGKNLITTRFDFWMHRKKEATDKPQEDSWVEGGGGGTFAWMRSGKFWIHGER